MSHLVYKIAQSTFAFGIAVYLCACATGLTNIQSVPAGANVYIIPEGQQPKKIGVTPLNISSEQITRSGTHSVTIQIGKKGYQSQSFLIPKMMFSSAINMSVKLSEDKLPVACTMAQESVEVMARNVARIQFLIQTKKYDQAERLLLRTIDNNPGSSTLYDLLGNVHYLNKKLDPALDAYEQSVSLDPNRPETQRMVNKLRSLLPDRAPSGGRQ